MNNCYDTLQNLKMMVQGKLINVFNVFRCYRNLLCNRITPGVYQQQTLNLKTSAKDKLDELKVPQQPKRPLTPYFKFLSEERPVIQKQHPEWKLIDITKHCAEQWKVLDPKVKEKFQQDFIDEVKVYEYKKQQFKDSLTKEQLAALTAAQKEKREKRKRRIMKQRYRETDKPKRPLGTFLYFIKDKWNLPENKSKKLTEMLTSYKDEWNNLPDNDKQKYIKLHAEDKERYEKQMNEWEVRMIKEGNTDIIRKESQITTKAKPLKLNISHDKKRD